MPLSSLTVALALCQRSCVPPNQHTIRTFAILDDRKLFAGYQLGFAQNTTANPAGLRDVFLRDVHSNSA